MVDFVTAIILAGTFSFCNISTPTYTSSEGLAEYGNSLLIKAPQRLKESKEDVPPVHGTSIPGGRGADKVRIPRDARRFLPDTMTKASPDSLRAKDDSVVRERAEELAEYFKKYYPDVIYHIDWDDDTVNAYAWKEGNERHVALLGGLLRHKALQIQGVALVLAHELGHHYAGAPTYSSGLSCEGQSDYWGAGIAMRTAYSSSYRETLSPAIEQVYTLFKRGVVNESNPQDEARRFQDSKGCSHPPADCRRETYLAAMEGKSKPECAGLQSK